MLESPIDLPSIYRETACGETRRSIVDDMFADRELVCVGNIDRELVNALILQIRCLEKQDPHAGIAIFINSPGGEVSSGLALYDVMQAVSCPIRTVCLGTASSMAALLFLSGDEREMLPHSTVMIHDPLIPSGVGGSALELRSVADRIMRTREVTAQVIAKHTGHSLDEVLEGRPSHGVSPTGSSPSCRGSVDSICRRPSGTICAIMKR